MFIIFLSLISLINGFGLRGDNSNSNNDLTDLQSLKQFGIECNKRYQKPGPDSLCHGIVDSTHHYLTSIENIFHLTNKGIIIFF